MGGQKFQIPRLLVASHRIGRIKKGYLVSVFTLQPILKKQAIPLPILQNEGFDLSRISFRMTDVFLGCFLWISRKISSYL